METDQKKIQKEEFEFSIAQVQHHRDDNKLQIQAIESEIAELSQVSLKEIKGQPCG